MSKLAINGGKKIRNKSWPKWPIVGREEIKLINEVVSTGIWSYNGPKEKEFSERFAEFCRTNYAICAANGTVTLQIALEALNIGYGDEVIVPGMTWQATASCCIDVNAIPILVDVEEDSWCIDPKKVEEAITSRTKAIIIVHLFGSNPKMDEILKLVKKHNLFLIEDCAHQHGTLLKGKRVGSFGDIGSFSFQQSKVLTSGEGGAVITNNHELAEKLDSLRNCGRKSSLYSEYLKKSNRSSGFYEREGSSVQSGNYRITEFQAAILLCQLNRLKNQIKIRDKNAIYLNENLKKIEGITPMKRDKEVSLQSYFNFAFRYNQNFFKGLKVTKFREALSNELDLAIGAGCEPLNNCELFRPLIKKRHQINSEYVKKIDPSRFELPACENAYSNEGVTFHHSVLMGETRDIDDILNAIVKIKNNVDELL